MTKKSWLKPVTNKSREKQVRFSIIATITSYLTGKLHFPFPLKKSGTVKQILNCPQAFCGNQFKRS
ncbi:MAG TPA: hypothetical protein VKI61_07375 [Chitinophagaceae bacterium]|jgi:hypothetical protein|nr:hypothetical protein [Chitinophagaceae bacterium]